MRKKYINPQMEIVQIGNMIALCAGSVRSTNTIGVGGNTSGYSITYGD